MKKALGKTLGALGKDLEFRLLKFFSKFLSKQVLKKYLHHLFNGYQYIQHDFCWAVNMSILWKSSIKVFPSIMLAFFFCFHTKFNFDKS